MPRPIEILSDAEIEKLLVTVNEPHTAYQPALRISRDSLMIRLMLHAGLRVAEVALSKWYHCWLNNVPLVAIEIPATNAKSNRQRIIPLREDTRQALIDWHSWSFFKDETEPSWPIFPGEKNHPTVSTRTIQNMVNALSLASIGRAIHPHVLRHTFGSAMIAKANIRVVQELLGHRSITTTQVYLHPSTLDLRRAVTGDDGPSPAAEQKPNGINP